MAEAEQSHWYVERGIGEDRALLTIAGQIRAARLHWHGEFYAGQQVSAQLSAKKAGQRRGVATADEGTQILVDHLPANITEGERVTLVITRGPIGEKSRSKLAQGRFLDGPASDRAWLDDANSRAEFASGCIKSTPKTQRSHLNTSYFPCGLPPTNTAVKHIVLWCTRARVGLRGNAPIPHGKLP